MIDSAPLDQTPPTVALVSLDIVPTHNALTPSIADTAGFGVFKINAKSDVALHPNSLIAVTL